ncbi:piwi-like protein 3 [Nannospalax galili]|uniref:piwi-like protein 3 n=1 Tax=Nannospalax galili TaxID=1026970 RepID=UPI0004ED5430|nr:piwi-like protein 3 [Nannospalax galili]
MVQGFGRFWRKVDKEGTQELSIRPNKSLGIFQDLVVNTRKKLNHVQASKRGKKGRMISLQTNHYRVTCDCNIAYKYNVDYRPDIKDINIRASLLLRHQPTLGRCHIFDGHSLLLPQRLPRSDMEFVSQTEGGDIVKIRVQLSKELHPKHPDWLRYYNILFRRMQIQRNYNTSILPYENVLTLCADVTHKLLQMKTVYDLITEKVDRGVPNLVEAVSEELLGSIVFTRYNKKTYRIDYIDWNRGPRNMFKKSDGSMISFVDYYRQQYNLVITDMNQPLLVSRGRWRKGQRSTPQEPVLLVPQLCYLTGLTSDIRTNHKLMSQLTRQMRMCPKSREKVLKEFMKKLETNQNIQDEFRPWKVKFDTTCLHISGRILDTVELYQRGKSSISNWLRESKSRPLLRPMPLKNWAILYPECCSIETNSLLRNLKEVSAVMGIDMTEANGYKVGKDPESYKETLRKRVTTSTQMMVFTSLVAELLFLLLFLFKVVCILPDHGKHRYDEIKRFLCVQCPVPSQCVVAETLRYEKTLRTMAVKIAQQMNCKMGGALWKVDTDMKNTMFIGIDCFHDIVSRQQSIAAFVASTNEELTKWHSQCLFQEPGQELVDGLRGCLKAALDSWFKNVRKAPQSVVVYRDGVGDGQLQALLDSEVAQMVEFFKRGRKPCIPLTFIVVKKRINTRFFVNEASMNPPPGTVVDQVVTREEWYDFYIVSQTSQDGTVTPTHYNVIYDTKGLYPDQVQCLTYKLCHMYYNLPGVIRVPAPCHYAHKLAYLIGKNIHQPPSESLSKYLYYL